MSAMRYGIPAAYADHRSGSGRRYMAFCRPYARLFGGTVPPIARPPLKLLGRLLVDQDRVASELERAVARRRLKDARRLRRQLSGMNRDVLALERRLEELAAGSRPRSFAAAVRRAGAAS